MAIQLVPIGKQHIESLSILANNIKISQNLRDGFPYPYTMEDASNFIAPHINKNPASILAIELDGIHVGNIGLHAQEDVYRKSMEIGYFIGEEYWGNGIATKAVKLMIDYGFKHFDIIRIYAGIYNYNKASERVLNKCGFKKEGVLVKAVIKNGKIWDEIRYAILRTE